MDKNQKKNEVPFSCSMQMSGNVATLDITGTIGWDTDPVAFNSLVDQAKEAGADKLVLRINSLGGFCYPGMAIADKLESCGMVTRGEVFGTAQSMASYILVCCSERVAHKNATIMVHQPAACIAGPVDDLLEQARSCAEMRDRIMAGYGKVCGMSGEEFSAAHMTMKMYNAEEALNMGLLTAIDGEGEDETPAPATPQEEPKARMMSYDTMNMALAMLAATPAEPAEPTEPAPTEPAEPTEPTPVPAPATPAPATPDMSAYVTREEVATMISDAYQRGVAAGVTQLGANPDALPGTKSQQGGTMTVDELLGMTGAELMHALAMHPELQAEYARRRGF